MAEQYTTLGYSITSGSMNDSQGSLSVSSAASFPTTGVFRIRIDDEILRVDSVSGTTFNVTRGQEGTTATLHPSASKVYEVITAAALDGIRSDITQVGAVASIQASPKAGDTYLTTDTASALKAYAGNAWNNFGPLWKMVPPPASGWSWVNQGTATVSAAKDHIYLRDPGKAGDNLRCYTRSHTASKVYIAGIIPFGSSASYHGNGIYFRQSSSGKLVTLYCTQTGDIDVYYWPSPSSAATGLATGQSWRAGTWSSCVIWLRIEDDNSNIKFAISNDGMNFEQTFSESRTAHFLSTGPDEVGIFTNSNNSKVCSNTLVSWYAF